MLAKLPYLLILTAFALIYVPRIIVIRALVKMPGGLDNHSPRDQQAQLTGYGKRAQGAHMNMIEAFPPFAAGMLAAMFGRVELKVIVGLGAAFVLLRIVYIACYLADKATLRSTVWSIATVVSGCLLLAPVVIGG